MSLDTLQTIQSRRVTRFFANKEVSDDILWTILGAARWAPTASGRRVHRYICINELNTVKKIKLVTPGMVGNIPPAIVVICVNWNLAGIGHFEKEKSRGNTYIDVGTSMVSILLAAHALGVGAGPITSFSSEAVAAILNIPNEMRPEMLITLGYPGKIPSSGFTLPKVRVPIQDLVQWGPFPD